MTTAVGTFVPTDGIVVIASQSGQFASATRLGAGSYQVDLNPIPGLVSQAQIFPVATILRSPAGLDIAVVASFVVNGIILVSIVDSGGTPTDASFVLNVALIGV